MINSMKEICDMNKSSWREGAEGTTKPLSSPAVSAKMYIYKMNTWPRKIFFLEIGHATSWRHLSFAPHLAPSPSSPPQRASPNQEYQNQKLYNYNFQIFIYNMWGGRLGTEEAKERYFQETKKKK